MPKLCLGEIKRMDVVLKSHYTSALDLRMEWQHDLSLEEFFKVSLADVEILASGHPLDGKLKLFRTKISTSEPCEMIPTTTPFHMHLDSELTSLSATCINGPNIDFLKENKLVFENRGFVICYQPLSSGLDAYKNTSLHKHDRIPTGTLTVTKSDASSFDVDAASKEIYRLSRFLGFCRGASSGVGHAVAETKLKESILTVVGFTPADDFKVPNGWFSKDISCDLPKIYSLYNLAMEDSLKSRAILKAIQFYRTANILQSRAADMAYVSAYAALEVLVPHILTSEAGWSDQLIGKTNIQFSDKLQAVFAYVGLLGSPIDKSEVLEKRAKDFNQNEASKLICEFRNKIIHSRKGFEVGGREIYDAINCVQWITEILIFYLISYRGEIRDRRVLGGWSGETKPMPLK